jgi:hypothetical protein
VSPSRDVVCPAVGYPTTVRRRTFTAVRPIARRRTGWDDRRVSPEERSRRRHDIAIWAGVSAFFANVIALEVVDNLLSDNDWVQLGGAVVASLFVALAIYSKQRLDDAKADKEAPDGP